MLSNDVHEGGGDAQLDAMRGLHPHHREREVHLRQTAQFVTCSSHAGIWCTKTPDSCLQIRLLSTCTVIAFVPFTYKRGLYSASSPRAAQTPVNMMQQKARTAAKRNEAVLEHGWKQK